jgi:propanediol dehydratase small subunit
MIKKAENEFGKFIDTLVDELIAMPDDKVLEGINSVAVQAEGERLLQAAIGQAGRARLAAAKAGVLTMKARPVAVSVAVTPEEARQFIARAANDGKYTLAARSLSDMPDDEALKLYNKLKLLESGAEEGDE